jgi:hypothetical protein
MSAKKTTEEAMLVDNPSLNSPFEEPTRYWAYQEGQAVLKVMDFRGNEVIRVLPLERVTESVPDLVDG